VTRPLGKYGVIVAGLAAGKVAARYLIRRIIHTMSDQPGILHGLNRQVMEAERLARLATRKRGLVDQLDESPTKMSKPPSTTSGIRQASNTSDSGSSSAIGSLDTKLVASKIALTQFTTTTSIFKKNEENNHLQYPTGVIKKTWAFSHERYNDIKIEEVLQKKDLTVAVLSSFQWHMEWLFSKFNVDTKLVFVMQAKDDATVGTLTNFLSKCLCFL